MIHGAATMPTAVIRSEEHDLGHEPPQEERAEVERGRALVRGPAKRVEADDPRRRDDADSGDRRESHERDRQYAVRYLPPPPAPPPPLPPPAKPHEHPH